MDMPNYIHLIWLNKFVNSIDPFAKKTQLYNSTHSWDEADSLFDITENSQAGLNTPN